MLAKTRLIKKSIAAMQGLQKTVQEVEDPAAREALETIRSTLLELFGKD
jgi:hypothetical protein